MTQTRPQNISYLESFLELASPKISFEFFPPKTDAMEQNLWQTITELEALNPTFVSVTYGAGGSTRERTHQTVKRILAETSLKPAAHLTCVAASKQEVNDVAQSYWDMGVRHIVALRGDPPGGLESYVPHPEGYAYSVELVGALKSIGDFEISVAAFPEVHPEAKSAEADLHYLKDKLEAGADRAITQYFFDTGVYLDFVERARKIGVTAPIVPGILLVASVNQFFDFSKRCGANVPDWVRHLLEGLDDSPETRELISAIIAAEQCRQLREAGVEQFHFYTLNRPRLAKAVCRIMGIK